MKYIFIVVSLFLLVSGCSRHVVINHSFHSNYVLGEVNTAFKNKAIIIVNDYYINSTYVSQNVNDCDPWALPFKYIPSENFIFSATINDAYIDKKLNIIAEKNKPLDVYDRKILRIEGIEYEAVYISDYNYAILIDKYGTINKDILYWRSVARPTYSEIKPPNVIIEKFNLNSINVPCDRVYSDYNKVCGTINYDMIYEGIKNGMINIRYREFSRDNDEKPINSRVYSFEVNSKLIKVKDFNLEIIEETGESIKYKVIDDNLKSREFMEWDYDPSFERVKSSR